MRQVKELYRRRSRDPSKEISAASGGLAWNSSIAVRVRRRLQLSTIGSDSDGALLRGVWSLSVYVTNAPEA
jgi:hypothetical protein